MDTSEFDDFKREIEDNGYVTDDFKLNHTDLTKWNPNQLSQIQGSATVHRISTKKEKSYTTGNGTHWVADFSNDFKKGFFN